MTIATRPLQQLFGLTETTAFSFQSASLSSILSFASIPTPKAREEQRVAFKQPSKNFVGVLLNKPFQNLLSYL